MVDMESDSTTGVNSELEGIDSEIGHSNVFMTGFPGFIASRLLRRLAAGTAKGVHFFFLVEERYEAEARERLQFLESEHVQLEDNWSIYTGDITKPDLGLSDEAYSELAQQVGVVWHLAAIYDLGVDEQMGFEINVEGTKHVLDFCEACEDFKRLNYISTCYVSGDRQGRIFEDELDEGQGHQNYYESTKFWAEVEVQRRRDAIPTAIFRPSIVVGDSKTGETDKYDGPYYLIKLLHRLPNWLPFVHIGSGDAHVNIVPVDFVTAAMAYIGLKDGASGRVYQLSDPDPVTVQEAMELILDAMNRPGAVASVPASWFETFLKNDTLESLIGIPREAITYFNHDAFFDSTNTQEALSDTAIRCPHFSTYVQTLVDYFHLHPESPAAGHSK